ncbi:MAG: hypothetical protein NVV59_16635 [Chitinophagaceae bacterium]|nr:hypothetical protein [Chitinophagaceae bacterium]
MAGFSKTLNFLAQINVMLRAAFSALIMGLLFACNNAEKKPDGTIENVILITTDGLRWQEVFWRNGFHARDYETIQ